MSIPDIKTLKELLQSPNQSLKEEAFFHLMKSSSDETSALFDELIHGGDEVTKICFCTYIATHVTSRRGGEILKTLMEDENEYVHTEAAKAFSKLTCIGRKDIILEMLKSRSEVVIDYAIKETGISRVVAGIELLIKLYETASTNRRILILRMLREIRGTEAIGWLLNSLDTSDEKELFEIIHTLGVFHNYLSWHKITKFLSHSSPSIRRAAVWFLNRYRSKIIRTKLFELYFKESDPSVRNEIIHGLVQYKDFKMVTALLEMTVYADDYTMQLTAGSALDKFSPKLLYKMVKKYRKHPGEKIRVAVLLRAGHLPYKKATGWLKDAFRYDPSEHVRAAAAEAFGTGLNKNATHDLEHAFLFDPSPLVQYTALMALTRVWGQNHWPKIYSILEYPEDRYTQAQLIVLRFLQKMILRENWVIPDPLRDRIIFRLFSENNHIRYLCIQILGTLKDKKALIPLIDLYIETSLTEEKERTLKAIEEISYDDPLFLLEYLILSRRNEKLFLKLLEIFDHLDFNPSFDYEIVIQFASLFLRERAVRIKKRIVKTFISLFQRKIYNLPQLTQKENVHWMQIIIECAKYAQQEALSIFGPEIFLENLDNADPAIQKIAIIMMGVLREERSIPKLTAIALKYGNNEIKMLAKEAVKKILRQENNAA